MAENNDAQRTITGVGESAASRQSAAIAQIGGNGPDVLLLHGYGADRLTWLGTAPALFDHVTVWVMDLPGHGKAGRDCGDGSVDQLVERVSASLASTGLTQLHLVGHSLGGRIALELATRNPHQVRSLAMLAPVGIGHGINQAFLDEYHQATDTQTITRLLQMLVRDPRLISKSLCAGVLDSLEQSGTREALGKIAQGLIDRQMNVDDSLARLHKLSIPMMTLWGTEDRINPPVSSLLASLPGTVHRLDDCGHLPHIEQRVKVNKLLV